MYTAQRQVDGGEAVRGSSVCCEQKERASLKATSREIAELQRVRGTHVKQIQFLNNAHQELQKEKNELSVEFGAFKNG